MYRRQATIHLSCMEEEPDLLARVDALARETATLSDLDEPLVASDLLAANEEIAQLRVALEHSTVIGQRGRRAGDRGVPARLPMRASGAIIAAEPVMDVRYEIGPDTWCRVPAERR